MKNGGYLIIDISGEDFSSTVTRTDIYEALDRNGVNGKPVMIYPKAGVGGVFGQVTKSGTSYVVGFIDADGFKGTVTAESNGTITRVYSAGVSDPIGGASGALHYDLLANATNFSTRYTFPADGYVRGHVTTSDGSMTITIQPKDATAGTTKHLALLGFTGSTNGNSWNSIYVRKGTTCFVTTSGTTTNMSAFYEGLYFG